VASPSFEPAPWLEFRIEETEGTGVDVRALSRLLSDLSSAFYEIARSKLGRSGRPGPRAQDEDALAAIRILEIEPGSAIIRAAPPPSENLPGRLFPTEPTPDEVALDFVREVQRIAAHEPGADRTAVRRRVQSVVRDASAIGRSAELVFRPVSPRAEEPREFRARIRMAEAEQLVAVVPKTVQSRRLSGHAYMVDVEPGKWRVRLKLPDGRDVTLDVAEELAAAVGGALDKPVEIESIEEREGDAVSRRLAVGLSLLPPAVGTDQPPKSVRELEMEQGLSIERPDYVMLATRVWETEDDVEGFGEYLRQVRGGSLG